MNYRVIYMVEEYTTDGNLVTRQYARNKKTAGRIARTCDKANDIIVRKLQKSEMSWVNPEEVQ